MSTEPNMVLTPNASNRLILKNELMETMYDPFNTYFNQEMEALAIRNCHMGTYQYKAFMHKAVLYLFDKPQKGPHTVPRLFKELVPQAERLILQKKEIEMMEKPLVADYIISVLMRSKYISDFFALLPEYLHQTLVNAGLSNTHNPKLTNEEIETFKSLHQSGYSALHSRAMWNLLLNS